MANSRALLAGALALAAVLAITAVIIAIAPYIAIGIVGAGFVWFFSREPTKPLEEIPPEALRRTIKPNEPPGK